MIKFSILKNRLLIIFFGMTLVFLAAALLVFLNRENGKDFSSEKILPNDPAKSGGRNMEEKVFPRHPIKLLFAGDMMFDRYIREAAGKYGRGDYAYALEPLKNELARYDLVVGNLEGPITKNESVSQDSAMDEKKNLIFTFDPAVANVLSENNIKTVSLGNNHILNQGEAGVEQTKKYLDEAGIKYFGDTGTEENESISQTVGGTKIALINYNYSIPGSSEKAIGDIKKARGQSDIIIVYPHWGTEYEIGDPGESVRFLARRFIDAGADAVIGTHPHVIQSSETYEGKKIYYSLGNFIFDQYFQKETMEGLGVEIAVQPDLKMEYFEKKFVMNRKGQTELRSEK
ncbi:MAG: CapA family protein [Parcubacteria group bacterium]|jgi:poly-gamma-glutamate synthesis protein (capsule biosynthesis protein)